MDPGEAMQAAEQGLEAYLETDPLLARRLAL